MSLSLYAATIPSYRQILGAVSGLLHKAQAFCAEKGIEAPEIIQARLASDMLPFAYQVKSTAVHSLGAIEGVRRGVFSPDMTPPPDTFAALEGRVAAALSALETIEPSEVESFVGRDMRFEAGNRRLEFTAEDFYERWQDCELGLILTQDFLNMEHVQRGLKSSGFTHARANPLQESPIINFHRAVRKYLGIKEGEELG